MPRIRIDVYTVSILGALAGALAPGLGCVAMDGPDLADEAAVGQVDQEVVYGADDRLDVYAHPDRMLRQRASQSAVVLMLSSRIDASDPDDVAFQSSTLQEAQNLCSSERFLDDPTAAFCSGTLIDDDLVLTAGHCARNSADCSVTSIVFNYYRTGADTLQTVSTQDIFTCAEIVVRQHSKEHSQDLDYAVIRLDRPATPRFTPAPVLLESVPVSAGDSVAVIGAGSGIPLKIDSGGTVRDPRASTLDFFVASTDTFVGNSGSGVYELDNYSVAGILVRGETDYRPTNGCRVVNTCTQDGCRGEDVNYALPAIDAYCAVATSARLCGDEVF
jgi:hypothetical protein